MVEKINDRQRAEIARRYAAGESQRKLAAEFGVSVLRVAEVCKRRGARRKLKPFVKSGDMEFFAVRAKAALQRQSPEDLPAWTARVEALSSKYGGLTLHQAVVSASKEFPCLHRLFKEFDVSEFDVNPDANKNIPRYVQKPEAKVVVNEGKKLSYRDQLSWALDAAGEFLRTGVEPEKCPCDSAYFLYVQAKEDPKNFLGRVSQAESKGADDAADRQARASGQRSLAEIEAMLSSLEQ